MKTAFRLPSIDSKVKPAELARPVGRLAAILPGTRVCACARSAPWPWAKQIVYRSSFQKCCIIVHGATLSRAIETYIGQTAVVVRNQHIWCSFAKSVSSVWQENAFFVVVVIVLLSLNCCHCLVVFAEWDTFNAVFVPPLAKVQLTQSGLSPLFTAKGKNWWRIVFC